MYLTTSELAKIFNLNRQVLHYYDYEKIFVPEYRDELTGYRKYSLSQINTLAMICYLKKIGLRLSEISELIHAGNTKFTIDRIKSQTQVLKTKYEDIMKSQSAIQRRLNFMENKLKQLTQETIIKHNPRYAYMSLGEENAIYTSEIIYLFPTIAFYEDKIVQRFGAYIEAGIQIDVQDAAYIKFIPEQDTLCFYHVGPWSGIKALIEQKVEEHPELNLSTDAICFNITDHLLEQDSSKFVTEVHLKIL